MRVAVFLVLVGLVASPALAQTQVEDLIKRAETGDVEAQAQLGSDYLFGTMRYQDGSGVEKDFSAAERWLTKAADQGNTGAQYTLGKTFYDGECDKRDYWKATKWLEGFEKGIIEEEKTTPPASRALISKMIGDLYYMLGEMRYQQRHPEDDFIPLDFCVPKGTFPPLSLLQDYPTARAWYRKAIERGNVDAAYQLAGMYHAGRGIPQDYSEAARWYQAASKSGHKRAPRALGNLHGKIGDLIASHMWFNIAGAAKEREEVERLMTSEQIVRAQKLATEWVQKHSGLGK
jgi:TPR repeat protein